MTGELFPSAWRELTDLLGGLDLDWRLACCDVDFVGEAPPAASPHHIAQASAVALLAQGIGVASLWALQTGRRQQVSIDVQDALHAVNSMRYIRQWGHVISPWFAMYSPLSGFHPTADGGFVYLAAPRARLRDGLLALLQCAHQPTAIRDALAGWTAQGFEDACAKAGLAGCRVRTADQWRRLDQGRWLANQPVVAIERIGNGPARALPTSGRPLDNLRVVDLSHILAGPIATRTLAEQGADVLRISTPRIPDDFVLALDSGFGKRAAYADLDEQDGRDTVERLLAEADVVVQSYRPGSLARRGLSAEQVAERWPGIVYLDISCYGGGPWQDRVGFDPNAQAATGISIVEGGNGTPALPPTELFCDLLTGYLGTAGILAALHRRWHEGGSYRVSVSLARTAMWIQDMGLVEKDGQRTPNPPRLGRMDSPFGELTFLEPAIHYSETSARWSLPPQPLGASPAAWNPLSTNPHKSF